MSGLTADSIFDKTENYKEFKGALAENYVLNELINIYGSSPFYWKSNNTAEVDFIIQNGSDIVPIEVKSERNVKTKSLAEYGKKYSPRLSIVLSMKNLSSGRIPLYMLWKLKQYLA
jgi:predicted AAA+ superfamily ATPase